MKHINITAIADYIDGLGVEAIQDIKDGEWDKVMTDALYSVAEAETSQEMAEARQAAEILADASRYTVINDGDVRYAVLTSELEEWTEANGDIEGASYDEFCSDVPYVGKLLGTPGNAGQIDLCTHLYELGADYIRF